MDTIGDFITIIRNASSARKLECTANYSKVREGIATVLQGAGYIAGYKVSGEKAEKIITVTLKYVKGEPAITSINRLSKPGRRVYAEYRDIPRVLRGLGITVLTTSKGFKSDKEARAEKLGGELVCNVW